MEVVEIRRSLYKICLLLTVGSILLTLIEGGMFSPQFIMHRKSNNQRVTATTSTNILTNQLLFLPSYEQKELGGSYLGFNPENITYEDACYKGTCLFSPLEWWYFDAVFNNNYSVEFHINIISVKNIGFAVTVLNIYKDGKILAHNKKFFPAKDLLCLKDKPLIALSGQRIMEGHLDISGNWIFNISLNLDDYGLILQFKSLTPGWKSKILDMWWWGVIQPKANVNGIIHLPDEIIAVNGTGYHEHVWNGKIPFRGGWYWGKFIGKSLGATWTNVIKSPWRQYLMLVLNQDNGGYINIPVEKIQYKILNYSTNDGWKIPTQFTFKIDYENMHLNIIVKTLYIQHLFILGILNYWRYHVKVQGIIKLGEIIEHVNNTQFMDLYIRG